MVRDEARRTADPLFDLFGITALELFSSPDLVVQHGELARLPGFMHQGPMQSTDSLCRKYVGALQVANGKASDGVQIQVNDAHASALLRLGLTVYFVDLKRSLPHSSGWLKDLETCLGLPECATLSAFANSAGSGLALHHDKYDQLFFQIRGEKQFRYAANGYVENPDVQFSPFAASAPEWGQTYRAGFPLTSEEVLRKNFETLHLKPGSVFFMPAGTWHTTAEQEGDSLSMVVVVRAPSRLTLLLNLIHYYAAQAPEWRARAYRGWSDDETSRAEHDTLSALMADLGKRVGRLPAKDAYAAWSANGYTLGTQREYPLTARFDRYIRLPNSSAEIHEDKTLGKLRCIVQSGPTDRPQTQVVLAFNMEARKVVDWVLGTRAQFTVDEACQLFSEFAREDLESLFAMLSQAALIRPLPIPEWDEL